MHTYTHQPITIGWMEYIDVLWKHAVPAVCRFVSVPQKYPFFLKSLEIEIKAGAVWWLVGNLRVFLVSKPIRLETTVELSCAPRYSAGWWLWCFQCKQFWGEYTVFLSLLFWQMFFVEDWESSSAAKVYWIFVWLRKQTMSFLVIRGLGRNTFNMSLWNDPLTWGPCLFSGGVGRWWKVKPNIPKPTQTTCTSNEGGWLSLTCSLEILLMVQKSQTTTWDVLKIENTVRGYLRYQLVQDFFHQYLRLAQHWI